MNEPDRSRARVDRFVDRVRRRLNRRAWWQTLAWSLGLGSAAMLAIALVYVASGHRVPVVWYPTVLAATALAAIVAWSLRRVGAERAALFADDFFALKDGVRSTRSFAASGNNDGVYELQAQRTAFDVAGYRVGDIRGKSALRLFSVALVLVLASALLGLRGDSPRVMEERQERIATQERTEEINELLADEVEREAIEAAKDDDEEEILRASELREWVESLDNTEDRNEALRQYARFEKRLSERSERLETAKQERLLAAVARELEKLPDARKLGVTLQKKQYRKAAQQLGELEQDPKKPLTARQKDLARLRAAARRMAFAARAHRERSAEAKGLRRKNETSLDASTRGSENPERLPRSGDDAKPARTSRSGSSGAATGSESSSSSRAQEGADGTAGQEKPATEPTDEDAADELADLLESLEREAEDLERLLEKLREDEKQDGQCDAEQLAKCDSKCSGVNRRLSRLGDTLRRLAARKTTRQRLARMRRKLASCSGYLCRGSRDGNSLSEELARTASRARGGVQAGEGSERTERDGVAPADDNGQTTALKGIKGDGPSVTTVESADDGSGTSSAAATARPRDFRRQFESFVAREDVPDDVRDGVREYFENIHEADESRDEEGNPNE